MVVNPDFIKSEGAFLRQADLRNNKLRLLRQEKGEVIEVEAPKFRAEKETELAAETEVQTVEPQPVVEPFVKEIILTETTPSNTQILTQFEFSSSSQLDYHQFKQQTLGL